MTHHTAASTRPARGGGLAGPVRAALTKLAGRARAASDAHARAMGSAVTPAPGPLGLNGRSHRDPRFSTRGRR